GFVDAKAEACNSGRGSRQAAMADDRSVGAQPRDEVVEPATLAFAAMLHVARDALDAVLEVRGLHRLAAEIGRARLKSLQRHRIVHAKLAQDEARRLELRQHSPLHQAPPELSRRYANAGSKDETVKQQPRNAEATKRGGNMPPLMLGPCRFAFLSDGIASAWVF